MVYPISFWWFPGSHNMSPGSVTGPFVVQKHNSHCQGSASMSHEPKHVKIMRPLGCPAGT